MKMKNLPLGARVGLPVGFRLARVVLREGDLPSVDGQGPSGSVLLQPRASLLARGLQGGGVG